MNFSLMLKKTWKFIWHSNSVWSWIINIIIAFLLVKYAIYPAIGVGLATSHPVVAVVSESMEHRTTKFCPNTNRIGGVFSRKFTALTAIYGMCHGNSQRTVSAMSQITIRLKSTNNHLKP